VAPEDPVERLFALEQFGIKLGLENITRLLDALGHPDRQFDAVHVAGTNGKGSVTAMVERAFRHAGHHTGRYTSPHLARIEERIAIDGAPVGADTFRTITADVLALVDRLRAQGTLEAVPTFFEATTAIAFEAFRRAGVEIAVVEVGLGGRYDATNVIQPRLTVITSIALDHQQHLGHTIASIAFEKAGILKQGVPLVLGDVQPAARSVIEDVARSREVTIIDAGTHLVASAVVTEGRATISVATPVRRYESVRLSLNGRHQIANAVIAIRTLEELERSGVTMGEDAIVAGLSDVQWPARLEWLRLRGDREILLDAAHNVAGAEALASYLSESGAAPLPVVLAIMRDKEVEAIVAALAPVASHICATSLPMPRALPADALADQVRRVAPRIACAAFEDPHAALEAALAHAPRVAAAGSIFLVGPLREQLLAEGALSLQC
jgi:dihydrofolate synthase/folylpolyglutamate synthase